MVKAIWHTLVSVVKAFESSSRQHEEIMKDSKEEK